MRISRIPKMAGTIERKPSRKGIIPEKTGTGKQHPKRRRRKRTGPIPEAKAQRVPTSSGTTFMPEGSSTTRSCTRARNSLELGIDVDEIQQDLKNKEYNEKRDFGKTTEPSAIPLKRKRVRADSRDTKTRCHQPALRFSAGNRRNAQVMVRSQRSQYGFQRKAHGPSGTFRRKTCSGLYS